jgi:hypothetical protein
MYLYNYLITGSFIISAVSGIYIFMNPNIFSGLIMKISWFGTTKYYDSKFYLESLFENTDPDKNIKEKEKVKTNEVENIDVFLLYNKNTECCLSVEEWTPKVEEKIKKETISISLYRKTDSKDKFKYKRVELPIVNKDLLNFTPLEKQFIQVELIQNEKSIDIHSNLTEYYYVDNKILDSDFLCWYLSYYGYDTVLEDNYEIKIIDKDVNMVSLSNNSYILLQKDGYEVKNKGDEIINISKNNNDESKEKNKLV